MTAARYVCAFRGRRDSYQAPLALAEGSQLDQFITDAYGTPGVRGLARHLSGRALDTLANRHEPGLPDERVRCLWSVSIRERLRHAAGVPDNLTWLEYDRYYSEAAAKRARETRSSLFLYSPYAWEAFTATYDHQPRRVLFQYHPHSETERRSLDDDAKHNPAVSPTRELDARPQIERLLKRERDCWQHADVIICSSSFTRRSLVSAGCPAERCRIVPYGVDLPVEVEPEVPQDFRAVFVGSGSRRKGLGHLLHAWRAARLPQNSRLTIVSRAFDPGLETLALETPGVEIVRGASAPEVRGHYASSALFVMPSLVEGFGLVYLEALAHGCPVLGTPNSGLPDIGGESDGIFIVPPADRSALTAMLERVAAIVPANRAVRAVARATASRYPWSAFRRRIREIANETP